MNTEPQSETLAGTLTREHWDVPIRVGLAPYVAFNRWLDGELEKLITRWQGKAAPCACSNAGSIFAPRKTSLTIPGRNRFGRIRMRPISGFAKLSRLTQRQVRLVLSASVG